MAAFTEPLSNVVHGISRTPINKGDTVGVIGIGPIGLMFCALAKLKGAKVIAMGRNPLKLKLAKEFAHADEVIDLKKYNDPTEIILSMTEEKGAWMLQLNVWVCLKFGNQCLKLFAVAAVFICLGAALQAQA